MTNGAQQPKPAENSTRINDDGDLEYADKDGNWVRYEDPAQFISNKDLEPRWVERGAAPDGDEDEG